MSYAANIKQTKLHLNRLRRAMQNPDRNPEDINGMATLLRVEKVLLSDLKRFEEMAAARSMGEK